MEGPLQLISFQTLPWTGISSPRTDCSELHPLSLLKGLENDLSLSSTRGGTKKNINQKQENAWLSKDLFCAGFLSFPICPNRELCFLCLLIRTCRGTNKMQGMFGTVTLLINFYSNYWFSAFLVLFQHLGFFCRSTYTQVSFFTFLPFSLSYRGVYLRTSERCWEGQAL